MTLSLLPNRCTNRYL